ncbi:hypothetical protein LR48_Vigan11g007100 [Vigna angularis]|uniref:Protein TIFY n=1 Tax=Phaseolus angularis TaxID=3914 RepID=A0A0L9VQM1_PHAAN|nr:Protein TIFY 10A Jasmonate ZIM domain-containing protein [Vigna angularis]KOM57039.1 hypothetical protein LR48_Vigan11g007100 [Vigna angularis]
MSSFPNTVSEGRRFGKAPEKSSFSQTCSLLSQFLKEKRASGDSTLGMGGKMEPKGRKCVKLLVMRIADGGVVCLDLEIPASTKDLFGSLQNSDGALKLSASAMDFLPQLVENPCIKKPNLRSAVPESPQMTIFYAGKMLVFDAFPPEKATEVMKLATKLALDSSGGEETPPSAPVTTKELAETKVPQTNTSEAPKPGSQGVGSDMRYPRRASLLKFLEKRKERVNARGPYQVNNQKPEGNSSGGDPEDQSSKQFDLNL